MSGKYRGRIIAVDFDGTCVTHTYPAVGRAIGAAPVLRRLVADGARLILYTMRSEGPLRAAVEWFTVNGIELWAVNENPEQLRWTISPKVYAHMYIDDAALGIPLRRGRDATERPYVSWRRVERLLYGGAK